MSDNALPANDHTVSSDIAGDDCNDDTILQSIALNFV